MNSQKPTSGSSFSSYQFDFGVGSNRNPSKPLRENPKPVNAPTYGSAANKPSWTHQPAPASASSTVSGSAMAGDIFGRSWATTTSTSDIGIIPKSNPNLFGDLLGSAMNQTKSNANVPLKAAAPSRSSFSMGNLADSVPNANPKPANLNSGKTGWGSADNLGNFSSLGGQPMKSAGMASGAAQSGKRDPFGSLVDFSSKNSAKTPISSAKPASSGGFGAFQNAPSAGLKTQAQTASDFDFGDFKTAGKSDFVSPAQTPSKPVDFDFGEFKNAEKSDFAGSGGNDPLDTLFASSGASKEASQFSEMNDWDMGAEFGGEDHSATTTELEGLPPPPTGVTASMATSKGMDNYKQGQYADAIKWLSWAVVLIEKSGDSAAATEVLVSRASCYKEVGEYKKAVADCSKVLENDSKNVSVLLQRALLYESTEKYRLGTEDLRMVLKIDPGNRLARSTIHRLSKLAD